MWWSKKENKQAQRQSRGDLHVRPCLYKYKSSFSKSVVLLTNLSYKFFVAKEILVKLIVHWESILRERQEDSTLR